MASVQPSTERKPTTSPTTTTIEMKLEVVVIPVSDVDRAKAFYTGLGWRLDAEIGDGKSFRGVQVTPPGSQCSVHFGKGITSAAPGSAAGLYLVVSDIAAARADLVARGVEVSDLFQLDFATGARTPGANREHRSYTTHATFRDPDGNQWILQEVNGRLPGRVDAPSFTSAKDLASALRRAETAHGQHEARTGQKDADWPSWYADFLLREQAGQEPPS
ncbi:VOC family protein [Sandaracinus amylolyticus]|uniref:VOC domain-containing protein n=1 Tax=Sandaracinus amylolyticus TaxID=927083 RepID=A0A0F6W0Y9_9BACT|nr:VOC family protein [Sandaracinus amylolyticus]AKF04465.1 hypothetical protein DB32_001614 [Sandaracinus amylolyticus]